MKHTKPNTTHTHQRDIKRNTNGQILILTGITLAISIILMASIAAELANLDIIIPQKRSTSLLPEFTNIKKTFGKALNYNLLDEIKQDPEPGSNYWIFYGDMANFIDTFNQTRDTFYTFELQYDNLFDATLNDYGYIDYSNEGNIYYIDTTLTLQNGDTCITEEHVKYYITCMPDI